MLHQKAFCQQRGPPPALPFPFSLALSLLPEALLNWHRFYPTSNQNRCLSVSTPLPLSWPYSSTAHRGGLHSRGKLFPVLCCHRGHKEAVWLQFRVRFTLLFCCLRTAYNFILEPQVDRDQQRLWFWLCVCLSSQLTGCLTSAVRNTYAAVVFVKYH